MLGNNVEEDRRLDSNAGRFISEKLRRAHIKQACLSYRLGTFYQSRRSRKEGGVVFLGKLVVLLCRQGWLLQLGCIS